VQTQADDNSVGRAQSRRLKLAHVSILYRREMRAAFREKNIVINSILIPFSSTRPALGCFP